MLFKSPRLIRLRKQKFFLFIIGMLLTMTTACANVKYRILTEESEEIPEPEQYDLSELARCTKITDYEYGGDGQLVKEIEYMYSDHDTPVWHKCSELLHDYDDKGRISKTTKNIYYTYVNEPRDVYETEYTYHADGTYTVNNFADRVTTYDEDGKILARDDYDYHYNDEGDLIEISRTVDGQSKVVSIVRSDTERVDRNVSMQSWQSGDGEYVVWLDYYDVNGNLTATSYAISAENIADKYSFAQVEMRCKPGYYAHYDGSRLVEEISCEQDRDIRYFYISSEYCFYDYDEFGRQTWYCWMIPSDTRLFAENYIYDETGTLIRRVNYTIYGGWEHTLYDGSTIEVKRNEEDEVTDIFRYHADGSIMHNYAFRSADSGGKRLELTYTFGGKGEITADWQNTISYYRAMHGYSNKGDFGVYEPDGSDTHTPENGDRKWEIYYVWKGDCLWSIAEKMLGDGNRWDEIYERNRAVIGDDPSRLYVGAELEITYEESD